MIETPSLRVVFDINVLIDAVLGADSTYPLILEVPPKTSNSAADCLALAFEGSDFELYASPHILENTARVLFEDRYTPESVGQYIQALTDIVQVSGGSIVEPTRQINDVADFEDNLVLDLVKAVDALILVTSDRELLALNPWRHRLVMSPRDFVERWL